LFSLGVKQQTINQTELNSRKNTQITLFVKPVTHILVVNRRRTDNAMAKWIKGQTTVKKTLHRRLNIEAATRNPLKKGSDVECSGRVGSS